MASDYVFDFFILRGDANHDGRVNLSDFNVLAGNFGQSGITSGPTAQDWATLGAAIPEPAVVGILALAGAALPFRRRGRRGAR